MTFLKTLLMAALLCFGLPAPLALAQQDDSSVQGVALEEIIVTASKRSQRLIDVSGSITVLTGAELEARRVLNMEELFLHEPGVSFQKTSPDQAFPVIRGINTGSALNLVTVPVGIYLGDVPVSDPQNPQSVVDANPIDVESVEILKGPQGALYGANALSGAVRYVFKRPDLDDSGSGFVDLSTLSNTRGSTGYRASGAVNFANKSATAGIRLAGWTALTPGYIDNTTANRSDTNDWENYGIRAIALFRPNDDLDVTLIATTQKGEMDDYFLVDDPSSLSHAGNPTLSKNEFDATFANLIFEYQMTDKLSLTSNTAVLDKERTVNYDITNAGFFCANFLAIIGLPLSFPNCVSSNSTTGEQFFQELRLAGDIGQRTSFVGGVSYQTSETDIAAGEPCCFFAPGFTEQITPLLPIIAPGITPEELGPTDAYSSGRAIQKNKETALFGDFEFVLSDRWSMRLGGRFWRNESELPVQGFNGFYTFLFFNPGSVTFENSFSKTTEDGFAPRASALFKVADDKSLYFVVSRGYRFGGVNVIPEIGETEQGRYDTDSLWNYEAGFRGNLGENFWLDAAAYYMDWQDAQIQVTGADNFQRVQNAGEAEVVGLEFAARWDITDAFSLSAGAALINAELSAPATLTPTLTVPEGTELPGTPDFASNVSANYRFTGPFGTDAELVLTHSHAEKYHSDIEQSPMLLKLGGYNLLDLRAVFARDKWEFSLFASNLTDEIEPVGVQTFPAATYAITTPRSFGIGARVQF